MARRVKMLKILAVVLIALAYHYYIYYGIGFRNDDNVSGNTVAADQGSVSKSIKPVSRSLKDVTATVEFEDYLQLSLKKSIEELATIEFKAITSNPPGTVTKIKGGGITYKDEGYNIKIKMYEHDDKTVCTNIKWKAKKVNLPIHDCIDIKGANWYGGPEVFQQRWPMQLDIQPLNPYVSYDTFSREKDYGSVLERYFLTSDGMALFIKHESPLSIGYDNERFCLSSDYDHVRYPHFNGKPLELDYTMCVGQNILDVHKSLLGQIFPFPTEAPHDDVFKSPIWSTWARFKMAVTQNDVKKFTEDIVSYGFPASHIEIDDMYTTNYGDWEWDTDKFPDPKGLTDFVHKKGFHVTTWIMPFVDVGTKAFEEGMKNDYLVKDSTGLVPGLVKWWQGTAGLIDFSNPDAVQWFKRRLDSLREVGVDSFKFDAGECQYLPPGYQTHAQLNIPLDFVKYYVEALREITDTRIEVRAAYQTQNVGILVRMMDKSSVWGYDNGLKTLIPSALHFGIVGYPFILPDMIGGNAYSEGSIVYGDLPEKELFIRWMELTAFLPSMQFSIAPWQYDEETTDIAVKFVKLHKDFVAPKIIELAKEATQNGYPIIRPIWWIAPNDSMVFDIDDQFLIGDDLLVAPIVEKGATKRNIYLPNGTWLDVKTRQNVLGPIKLKDYSIKLDEIGLFQRV